MDAHVKQAEINDVIRKFGVIEVRMSIYSFSNKRHALEYEKNGTLPSAIPSLYNDEAVRFIIKHLRR